LTAAQRWNTLLEETRVAEGSHLTLPNFLTGGGVLWEDLVEGLPVPLPTPTPRVGTESLMPAAKQSRVKFLQKLFRNLLLGVSAAIPNYDEEALLADCDVARYTIQRCAFRFKEFYAWCNETAAVNPNYVRMRTILSQLQISLRNTAILLEDPKRYLEAFARIDPQGVMFQAEVLSLQDDRMMKRDKVEIVPAGQPQPQGRGATANPLQESFFDNPIGSDEVRLCATKARDIVSMMNKDSTNPTSASNSSAAPQVHVALRLFRQRAFKQLRYIMLILQNLVEIESFYLRDRWTSVEI
jgi:hypothetical protein